MANRVIDVVSNARNWLNARTKLRRAEDMLQQARERSRMLAAWESFRGGNIRYQLTVGVISSVAALTLIVIVFAFYENTGISWHFIKMGFILKEVFYFILEHCR
jgi:hypothetical protein